MGLVHLLQWYVTTYTYFQLSLIKMLYWVVWNNCETEDGRPTDFYLTESQLKQAVRRNFGGSDEFDSLHEFEDCLQSGSLMQVLIVVMYCISNLK